MKSNNEQVKIKANFNLAKVLVIDDSDDHWHLIQKALKTCLPEVASVRAASPQQALTLLKEWETQEWELPKQILLDLYLPDRKDGWGILQQIKAMPAPLNQIPIVMLSSSTDNYDILEAYQLGVSSYLVKPGSYDEWLAYFQELRAYWWETTTLPPLQFTV
ncbi:response regulator [Spirosoma fluviale]|uniref:CheY chemotaxis protein or a CheY-like REC (Receiver) domain n=1 Tax=Spirosoma fluviale TaxID=1597977 RepID=A0A286G3C5_9BACT|nr:response regulator [Spirosoma fluviale]SOD89988.1 CheY chemotaxis protein or a CheY-like REC (receiver) domain [Spirosoma fluviale]